MKKIYLLFCIVALSFQSFGQFTELVFDDLTSDPQYNVDLSTLLLWGGNTDTISAFEVVNHADDNSLSFPALCLTAEGIGQGGYNSGSTYTSTAVDYLFPRVYRYSDTIRVEFDYMSEQLSGSGESGRLGIALLYDYPDGGPQFNDVYNNTDPHPFGRPTYNLRMLNGTSTAKQAYLFYGGGQDELGEFEQTGDNVWLPGFISGPGGTSPGSESNYPYGPVRIGNGNIVSATQWMHYTFELAPERLNVYSRPTGTSADQDQLVMFMAVPSAERTYTEKLNIINEAHNTAINTLPTYYHWFEQSCGVRFYYRSIQNGYLTNIKVSATEHTEPTTVQFASTSTTVSEDAGSVLLPLDIANPSPAEATVAKVELTKGDSTDVGNYTAQLVEFPAGSSDQQTLSVSITDDAIMDETDTLEFTITTVTGGIEAQAGTETTFKIIINDNEFTSIAETNPLKNISIYPNPVRDRLIIDTGTLTEQVQVQIFSLAGALIQSYSLSGKSQIDLSHLSKGYYFIKVSDGEHVMHQKIIKH